MNENTRLVNHDSHAPSVSALETFYANRRIPAEKKPFLVSLRDSSGPLMAVEKGPAILDVASQIATLGLGFNSGVMFGVAEFLESWTGRTDTPPVVAVRRAFNELLARRLGREEARVHLCHSGAEAVEIALGMCYEKRANRDARRVIAFKNSFHGRMKIALASTWNPDKRAPFEWPSHGTDFAEYPESDDDDVSRAPIPAGWQALWSAAPRTGFDAMIERAISSPDPLLAREIESLLEVRGLLRLGSHFAVIVEPMQCEGGDRYSTARFHHGLVNLCRAFDVPLVYDEIQTGFGLGGEFFWHGKFGLLDHLGQPVNADYVVVAKKAQVGAVLSGDVCRYEEQFNASSLIRGFLQASMIDQYRSAIEEIEVRSKNELARVVERHREKVQRPRAAGLCFAFDFADAAMLKSFVDRRFQHGLMYYPAGERAARFRFNLAFRGKLLDAAWRQIHAALDATLDPSAANPPDRVVVNAASPRPHYEFHERLVSGKLGDLARPPAFSETDAAALVLQSLCEAGLDHLQVDFPSADTFDDYRLQIEELESSVYEPLRQTPIEKFERLVKAENSIAILVREGASIVGMAFAAPPANFPRERGLRGDPLYPDPRAIYMLDLTVVPEYRGKLGRILKQAICLVARQRGLTAVIGRNRDRLARGMWAINLSLGSYCTRVIREDYMDEHAHRDCLMYRCDLQWPVPPLDLSGGVEQPLIYRDLTETFCHENLPALVNKLTLSNFVTADFLENLEFVFSLLPEPLRHGYTANGISECVDKLVKALWLKRSPRTRLVTIDGSWFGEGSFLARSLSGRGESFFDATRIPHKPHTTISEALSRTLESDDVLAVFVEPLGWKNGRRLPMEVLHEIRDACTRHDVPLVSHDSGGLLWRYAAESFAPSGSGAFVPDAGMMSMGGQMALCYLREEWFDATPLMFISTWDGDSFSLAQFAEAVRRVAVDPAAHERVVSRFQNRLIELLKSNGVTRFELTRGVGWFEGPVESTLAAAFRSANGLRRVCLPGPGSMRRFVEDEKGLSDSH